MNLETTVGAALPENTARPRGQTAKQKRNLMNIQREIHAATDKVRAEIEGAHLSHLLDEVERHVAIHLGSAAPAAETVASAGSAEAAAPEPA